MSRVVLTGSLIWCLACGDGDTSAESRETDGLQGSAGAPDGAGGSMNGAAGTSAQPATDIISVEDGDFRPGEAPSSVGAEALPGIVRVTGPSAVTNGGTAVLLVELSAPVAMPMFVVSRVGDSGFHTVTGTDQDGDGVYEISVRASAEATATSLVLRVGITDGNGNIGDYAEVTLELVQSGTGDVKITLSFDRVHDLDLHVFEPNGEEISYLNDASATGGQLDLDSGANCTSAGANNENVFWPPGGAPAGEYRVTVHNYEQCSPGAIQFSVRVAHDGEVNTYQGSFADGTEGSVAEVATFTR